MISTSQSEPIKAFSTPTVSKLTGIPTATLNHWVVTKLIKPSVRGPAGRRATRYWSITDLIQVRAIRALRKAGCPLQQLKKVRKLLDGCGDDFANRRLVWTGYDILVLTDTGGAESALRHPGQGIIYAVSSEDTENTSRPSQYQQKSTLFLGNMHEVATRQLEKHRDLVYVDHLKELHRERVKLSKQVMKPA